MVTVKNYYNVPRTWMEPSCVENGHDMSEDPNDPTSSHCTACGRSVDEVTGSEGRHDG
jgi:hypothetical protein